MPRWETDSAPVAHTQFRGSELSAGALAGIVIGFMAGSFIIVGMVILLCYGRRERKRRRVADCPYIDASDDIDDDISERNSPRSNVERNLPATNANSWTDDASDFAAPRPPPEPSTTIGDTNDSVIPSKFFRMNRFFKSFLSSWSRHETQQPRDSGDIDGSSTNVSCYRLTKLKEFRTWLANWRHRKTQEQPHQSLSRDIGPSPPEPKVIPIDRILGTDKESFINDLPRLEPNNTSRAPLTIAAATDLAINPHDFEYGPNPGIFPHLAKIVKGAVDADSTHALNSSSVSASPPVLSAPAQQSKVDVMERTPEETQNLPGGPSSKNNHDLYDNTSPETNINEPLSPVLCALTPMSETDLVPDIETSTSIERSSSSDVQDGIVYVPLDDMEETTSRHDSTHQDKHLDADVVNSCDNTKKVNTLSIPIGPKSYENITVYATKLDPPTPEGRVWVDVDENIISPESIKVSSPPESSAASEEVSENSNTFAAETTSTASSRTTPSFPSLSPISTVYTVAADFPCPSCHLTFKSPGQCRTHYNRRHIRRYSCVLCKKRFHLCADLKRHQMTVHRPIEDAQAIEDHNCASGWICPHAKCKFAGKKWNRKDNFTRHVDRCGKDSAKRNSITKSGSTSDGSGVVKSGEVK